MKDLPAFRLSLRDVVAEYDRKSAALADEIAAFEAAGAALKAAACVAGEWGNEKVDTGYVHERTLRANLLRSAWLHVWKGLNLPTIASAKDKQAWDQAMASPAPLTLDNIRATLGRYLEDPRATIIRGMAEVFADLDPAYRSHEKMKIGVKGLPKRVILHNVGSYTSWGEERLRNIINALAAYQGKPLLTHPEMALILKDGEALRDGGEYLSPFESERVHRRRELAGEPPNKITVPARGVWLKRFGNGNGHLFFGPEALRDINLALAEFYGDVLPDCPEAEDRPDKPRTGTAVAADLQFYPTPTAVIETLMGEAYRMQGKKILEPSCGDGRILDALRKAGADAWGVEVHPGRAAEARAKGHKVTCANFLDLAGPARPDLAFDMVVMNPPFYGRHYAKHVRHALRFLRPGGMLYAILPATARYDHGELDGLSPSWRDLPVGAFSESGTNICTTIATIRLRTP